MDTTGLDVPKLKSIVIEKWRSGPEFWPVKVLSMSRKIELEKENGKELDAVGGYFTCLRNIRAKTPAEMEDILGLQQGSFSSGVAIWKFKELPKSNQFNLRGYTQTPGGENFDGIVIRRNDRSRPEFFERDGSPAKYPPGLAVEQWEVCKGILLPATELDRVAYGAKFLGWR